MARTLETLAGTLAAASAAKLVEGPSHTAPDADVTAGAVAHVEDSQAARATRYNALLELRRLAYDA